MAEGRAWLVKSEPGDYSIDDLAREKRVPWTGVRNYKARNFMRDAMKVGDPALFYHSNADPSGVVGLARVASEPYPDPLQFDRRSPYFDAKSSREDPRWQLVDIAFVEKLPRIVSLGEIKGHPALKEMALLKLSRLSVQPVREAELQVILRLAEG
ncbi:MAG: EVE domain-containing protein [Gemmatimonadetes bacterium]|nr:EVE domain-containing protein [Gemmatimonadota bacterium]